MQTPTQSTMQLNPLEESKGQLHLFIIPGVTENQGTLQPCYCDAVMFLFPLYLHSHRAITDKLQQSTSWEVIAFINRRSLAISEYCCSGWYHERSL